MAPSDDLDEARHHVEQAQSALHDAEAAHRDSGPAFRRKARDGADPDARDELPDDWQEQQAAAAEVGDGTNPTKKADSKETRSNLDEFYQDPSDAVKKGMLDSKLKSDILGRPFVEVQRESGVKFRDYGDRITAPANIKADDMRAMVATAKEHGWPSIELKGPKRFKEAAWMEAQREGIKTKGFEPSPELVQRLQKEREDHPERFADLREHGDTDRFDTDRAVTARDRALPTQADTVERADAFLAKAGPDATVHRGGEGQPAPGEMRPWVKMNAAVANQPLLEDKTPGPGARNAHKMLEASGVLKVVQDQEAAGRPFEGKMGRTLSAVANASQYQPDSRDTVIDAEFTVIETRSAEAGRTPEALPSKEDRLALPAPTNDGVDHGSQVAQPKRPRPRPLSDENRKLLESGKQGQTRAQPVQTAERAPQAKPADKDAQAAAMALAIRRQQGRG